MNVTMTKLAAGTLSVFGLSFLALAPTQAQQEARANVGVPQNQSGMAQPVIERQKLPRLREAGLMFERNEGQVDPNIDFLVRGRGESVSLRSTGFSVMVAPSAEKFAALSQRPLPTTLSVRLLGARETAKPRPSIPLLCKINDYGGANPKQWHLNIPTYGRVQYSGIYDGVDVAYHGASRELEYDFNIAPGTDPGVIRIAFEGADNVTVDAQGNLISEIHGGSIVQRKPVAYQEVNGERKPVQVGYLLDQSNRISFQLGFYDRSRPVIIDPISYSVLFGQPGNDAGNHVAVDAAGNAYVAGWTTSPRQSGTSIDAVVAKFGPSGMLLWQNFYHGNATQDGVDKAFGIALDGPGTNVFVTGTTTSDDFPTTDGMNGTVLASSGTCGGPGSTGCNGHTDAFVMKLPSAGGSPIYSSYFGGAYNETANAIAVDAAGMIYITGQSGSIPMKGPSFAMHSGGQCQFDAYLAKFDPTKTGAASLVFATLLGGDGNDEGKALAVAPGTIEVPLPLPCPGCFFRLVNVGTVYVAGNTGQGCIANTDPFHPNTPFPTTPNAFAADGGFQQSGFIALLDTTGTRLLYSSVVPADSALGVAAGPPHQSLPRGFSGGFSDGFVTGNVAPSGLGTPGAFQTTFGHGTTDAYAARIDPTKSGAGSLVYLTLLGGSGNEQGNDIAVDSSGAATIAGETNSSNFPITSSTAVQNALNKNQSSGQCGQIPCRTALSHG